MPLTAANVTVGVTGRVYYAPAGTAVPTSVNGALNAAFKDVGYVTEDGVTTSVSTDTNEIKAWQNGDTVRRVQTAHDYTVSFAMLETNENTLGLFYGNYVAGGAGANGVVSITGAQPFRGAFVIDVVDGLDLIRIVVPDGQITEPGDVSYVNGDAVTYPVTLTAYPNAAGTKATLYFESDGAS